MRKLILCLGFVGLSIALLGCPKKDGAGDGGADAMVEGGGTDTDGAAAAGDAAAAPAAVNAKNTASVARFPGETPIANEVAKVAQPTPVHTEPHAGAVVAMLKVGTDVTKVASYKTAFLVTFADPKDATSTLLGWIGTEAFTAWRPIDAGITDAAVDAAAKKLTCAAGQVAVVLTKDPAPVCKKKCTKDTDCKDKAAGACANANAATGQVVRACVND